MFHINLKYLKVYPNWLVKFLDYDFVVGHLIFYYEVFI